MPEPVDPKAEEWPTLADIGYDSEGKYHGILCPPGGHVMPPQPQPVDPKAFTPVLQHTIVRVDEGPAVEVDITEAGIYIHVTDEKPPLMGLKLNVGDKIVYERPASE